MRERLKLFRGSEEITREEEQKHDRNQSGPFNTLRSRASKTLPNFALLKSVLDKSPWAHFLDHPRELTATIDEGSRSGVLPRNEETLRRNFDVDEDVLRRRRSNSLPPEAPQQTLRRRAILLRDSALLDLRARASTLEFSKLPSFRFSLPFSDSGTTREASAKSLRDARSAQLDSDNTSLTSLELESLVTDQKVENNRLRGLIEGLPRLGIPGVPEEDFAGLSNDTRDLNIVVLGGYRGSILRSSEDNRMLWIPVKVGLGIRKVDLELPLDSEAETNAEKTIHADGMLTHIGPVDISRRLLKKLRAQEDRGFCKVYEFGYDWRLSGELPSERLTRFLENLSGKALVVAHSLGGLITLHALNKRPELFRGVLFAGTPFHGCPNILGPFRYGDGVLLNKEILNARTNFSMRSSFVLLPTHNRCFVDIESGKELPIDFFDPQVWKEYGLSPEVSPDHGAHDLGEAEDINGAMATAGIGGPSMGNSTTNKDAPRNDGATATSSTASRRASDPGRDDNDDRARRQAVWQYLETTLRATLQFKKELKQDSKKLDAYPPIALLRSASTPTVRGCSVHGYQGIKDGDYSKFIFSPGDGVVTFASSDIRTLDGSSRWDRLVVKEVENDRGHIGLLGDTNGVEACLFAILNTDQKSQDKSRGSEMAHSRALFDTAVGSVHPAPPRPGRQYSDDVLTAKLSSDDGLMLHTME